ncbi:MAG: tetratricopeptide repeat protein [bacterium]
MGNIKSYRLSAQLKAELNQNRKSRTPFPAINFSFLENLNFKKIPFRGIALFMGVFTLIVLSYTGIKSLYEYSLQKNEKLKQAQVQEYQDHLDQIKGEVGKLADSATSYVTLSQKFLKEKDIEKAEAAAKLATEKDPAWRDGFINEGHVMLSANKFEEAKQAFEKALAIDPICGQAHYLLSLTYQELKNNDLAKVEFAKAKQFGFETEIGG